MYFPRGSTAMWKEKKNSKCAAFYNIVIHQCLCNWNSYWNVGAVISAASDIQMWPGTNRIASSHCFPEWKPVAGSSVAHRMGQQCVDPWLRMCRVVAGPERFTLSWWGRKTCWSKTSLEAFRLFSGMDFCCLFSVSYDLHIREDWNIPASDFQLLTRLSAAALIWAAATCSKGGVNKKRGKI